MSVEYVRPELEEMLPAIMAVEDVVKGPHAVKAKKETYLPKPDPTNNTPENNERYKQLIQRAMLLGATGQTLEALIGQVFDKEPSTAFPPGLEFLEQDSDGQNLPFEDLAREGLRGVLKQGRSGFFVDYPEVQGPAPVTKADQVANKLQPVVHYYDSKSIVNWRLTANVLTTVVLKEDYVKEDDGFQPKTETQYRVLKMVGKVYTVEIWRKEKTEWKVFQSKIPVASNGTPLEFIPFIFAGWRNNKPTPDPIPLEPLAELELGHYRNSADLEENAHICGQATPVFAGLSEDWVKNAMKNEVRLGSRAAIPLPEGGSAMLLQATETNLPKTCMEMKETQMAKIGARLVEPSGGGRTATEAALEASAEKSVLAAAATNVSRALESVIKAAAVYAGVEIPEQSKDAQEAVLAYELNTDFSIARMSPEERQVLMAELQGGGIAFEEYRWNLLKAGVAYLDDEKAKAAIEAGVPGGGVSDPGVDPGADPNQDPNAQ